MIDWDRVEELKSEVGEEDFAEIIGMFFEEVEDVLQRLCQPNSTAQASDLHFVKGSALNIGLAEVSDLCRSMETRLRDNPNAAVDLAKLQGVFRVSKAELWGGIAP